MIYIVAEEELKIQATQKPDEVPTIAEFESVSHLPRVGEVVELRVPGENYKWEPAYLIVTRVVHQLFYEMANDRDIYIVVKPYEFPNP